MRQVHYIQRCANLFTLLQRIMIMTTQLRKYQTRIEQVLDTALNHPDTPDRLQVSMRYSVLDGGKRVRAMLVYAAGLALNVPLARLDAVAAALECIHGYSLIHDDLPAMDDDDLRRGKATNHKKFDEATAILAGDALQAVAFEIINAEQTLSDKQARQISLMLAEYAGRIGMVGGQMLDMQAMQQILTRDELENVHLRKTGALIRAAVVGGSLCADNVTSENLHALDNYAQKIGLAFQVVDDVLDIESSTEMLGKTSGADQAMGKSTYPALLGLKASKQLAQDLYSDALMSIESIDGDTSMLVELASLVVNRNK